VLKSWAVPKGPSLDPAHRRLAMEVEDHPKSWAKFEGVIGRGYGAGTVIVWDRGTFRNLSERDGEEVSMAEALAGGHASFWLEGEKLQGAFSLRRMEKAQRGSWLLHKRRDEEARAGSDIVSERPESAVSGLTIEEVAERG
jgi:DNA ligase D-like protein (predicted 3'-phosphoesterase)